MHREFANPRFNEGSWDSTLYLICTILTTIWSKHLKAVKKDTRWRILANINERNRTLPFASFFLVKMSNVW